MGEAESMNRSLCLTLMAKDARHVRLWLGLAMAVAALALAHPFLARPAEGDIAFTLLALEWIAGALLVLAAARLVHGDAGESSFLATRPAPLPERLLAKALVMALALVPLDLIQCVHLGLMRLHLSPFDYVLLFTEKELIFGSFVFAALVLALITPGLSRFVVGLVAIAVLWAAGACIYRILNSANDPAHRSWLAGDQLRVSRMVMLQAAVLGACVAALWRYAGGSGRRALIAPLAAGAAVCVALGLWWPVNFISWLADYHHVAPRAEWPDPSRLTFHFYKPPGIGNTMPTYAGGSYDGVSFQTVNDYYRVDGLPALWTAGSNGWNAVIHLSDGRELRSNGDPIFDVFAYPAQRLLGVNRNENSDEGTWNATVAVYKELAVGNLHENAKLDGTMLIPLTRPIILGDMPLREGASVTWRRQRLTIKTVAWSAEEVHVDLIGEAAHLTLRGGEEWERSRLFIVNPRKHECLDYEKSSGSYYPGYANYCVSTQRITRSFFPGLKRGETINIPEDWRNDARLYVVGVESGGELTVPYHYSSLDLGNDQPAPRR